MINCPVCFTETNTKYKDTPYWVCPSCDLWFQNPLPIKRYEGTHELDSQGHTIGHLMSDHEKQVNKNLADWLSSYIKLENHKALDIGSKYPYLSYCLKNRGIDAYGMDNITVVPEYSKSLGVPLLQQDFESWEPGIEHIGAYKLITLVHMFEHLYNPVEGLKKIRRLLHNDGIVYIRSPAHDVTGIERDLIPSMYEIHPYVYNLYSFLEVLNQLKQHFVIEYIDNMQGAGQRDIILRPVFDRPTIYVGMIVKNEERDLPVLLDSIKDVADGLMVLDTGSTDKTYEVVKSFRENNPSIVVNCNQYLEASERVDNDWKLLDFSKARNEYLSAISATTANWVLNLDADDKVLDPRKLSNLRYLECYKTISFKIAPDLFLSHRMWKNKIGIEYEGAVHEYPTVGSHRCLDTNLRILHNYAAGTGESSNARNLRILQKEYAEKPTSRNAFYLAQTYHHGGKYKEAIDMYSKRLAYPMEIYPDEYLFAILYKARCERAIKDFDKAIETLFGGIGLNPEWAEFWMELSYIYYDRRDWGKSMAMAMVAKTCRNIPTGLWRENNKYRDQPLRIISFCYENMGDKELAIRYAKEAKVAIGGPDGDWDSRLSRLNSNDISGSVDKRIALLRPGSIGDIVMTLNLVNPLKQKYPGYKIDYICAEGLDTAMGNFIKSTGIDEVYALDTSPHHYEKVFNLVGYPLNEGYPWTKMKKHLVDYFAEEAGVNVTSFLELKKPAPIVSGKYITIHPKSGWSKYKDWPLERWAKIIQCLDVPVYQIGAETDPKVTGAKHDFMGAPLEVSIALFANASMHMGIDSFTNHLSSVRWDGKQVPSIILWGSTQVDAAGYKHNVNISKGLKCQPCFREDRPIAGARVDPCPHGHQCMFDISTQEVLVQVMQLWSKIHT